MNQQGALMELAQDKRGELKELKYLTPTRSALIYEMPLAEVRACACGLLGGH